MQTISIALMISDNDKSQDVAKQQHFDEINTQLGCQIVSIPLTTDQSIPTTSDHVPLFNSLDQVVTNWDYCDQDVNTILDSILSTIASSHFPDTSLDSAHIPEGYRKAYVCAQSINGEVRKLPILISKDIHTNPHTTIRSRELVALCLQQQTHGLSFNKSSQEISTICRQKVHIAPATLHDLFDAKGDQIRAEQDAQRKQIFAEHGFTESGKPVDVEATKKELHIGEKPAHMNYTKLAMVVRDFNHKQEELYASNASADRNPACPPQSQKPSGAFTKSVHRHRYRL